MTFNRWFLSLIFLIIAFVLMADAIAFITYVAAKLYIYFVRGIPFGIFLPGFFRLIRGASFGGVVAGIGCWFIYYKNRK